jgi:hypothetical protein
MGAQETRQPLCSRAPEPQGGIGSDAATTFDDPTDAGLRDERSNGMRFDPFSATTQGGGGHPTAIQSGRSISKCLQTFLVKYFNVGPPECA